MNALRIAARFEVSGVVQGVGFRPFVHRLAGELRLDGRVSNTSTEVIIEVSGPGADIDRFAARLVSDAPPSARIDNVSRTAIADRAAVGSGFDIVPSTRSVGGRTLVAPDIAVCDACVAEMFDPTDRRHRHPFITCTDCGPRFTIIEDVPYDRPATTMRVFEMCPGCRAEYEDPQSRRHHAQPICCPSCGPVLRNGRGLTGEQALSSTIGMLDTGRIVAIKGLGGFHLACDALSSDAVARLRQRKDRPDKPFAVMVGNIEAARRLAHIDEIEEELLTSSARPIVLLSTRADSPLSPLVAPGNPLIGVMLPYTPIHHLLFADGAGPLVMTSGNVAGEPICHLDDDVDERLGSIIDDVLTHDRPIAVPCDDSVVRVVGGSILPVRRARGYAPLPVGVPHARRDVLATGGELKNTACVISGGRAFVSQHLGDMENKPTVDAFETTVRAMLDFWEVTPAVVATDSHPGYATSRWAHRNYGDAVVEVQHHHAHVAAVMAEHGLDPDVPILGFAFDGTGYGVDGTIWGGEVLVATAGSFERVAALAPVQLPGGDAAVRHPARVALSHLRAAGVDWCPSLPPVEELSEVELCLLDRILERGVQCVPTTSMGRLFDAVGSLLGLRHQITYEAQAAIDLEAAAAGWSGDAEPVRFEIDEHRSGPGRPGLDVIDPAPVIRALAAGEVSGRPVGEMALAFHEAVAVMVAELAVRLCDRHSLDVVALSGGVFQNALLTELTTAALDAAGVPSLTHRLVPPNDGGLALGQAYVAAHSLPEV